MKLENEFIPYEQALALKKIGFDEQCFGYYGIENELNIEISYNLDHNLIRRNFIAAPLWQQVIDWFKDKYNFEIYILPNHHNKYKWGIITNWCKSYARNDFFDCILYSTLYEAREQAILKAIELIKNGNITLVR